MHALQNYIAGLWNHWVAQIYLHIYCYSLINAKFATFAQTCKQQTWSAGWQQTWEKRLIEKYSEIDNTEIFLK